MPFVERRNATRFDLQLPVVVRWRDGSEFREVRTQSEDVSSQGIYFVLTEGIKDGTAVELEVTLPNQITFEEKVRVRCSGHILRSELDGSKAGVAAVIEAYRFLSERRGGPIPIERVSSGDDM
jgi:c-di-GMP-binding flagellar brake protein YcgR